MIGRPAPRMRGSIRRSKRSGEAGVTGDLKKNRPLAAVHQATLRKPRNRREPASAAIRFNQRVFVLE